MRYGGIRTDFPDRVDQDRLLRPRDVVGGCETRGNAAFISTHQGLGAGDPGFVVTLAGRPNGLSINGGYRVERGSLSLADYSDKTGRKTGRISDQREGIVDFWENVVKEDVTLGEVDVCFHGGSPERAIILVKRGRIEARRDFGPAPVDFAAQELVQVEPKVVLKDETATRRTIGPSRRLVLSDARAQADTD